MERKLLVISLLIFLLSTAHFSSELWHAVTRVVADRTPATTLENSPSPTRAEEPEESSSSEQSPP